MSIKDYYPNISKSRIGRFNVVMIVLSYILQDLRTVQRMLLYSQIWGGGVDSNKENRMYNEFWTFYHRTKNNEDGVT